MGKGSPTKVKRNNKLFELKKQLTFRALAVYFHISDTRAKQIYYNMKKKKDSAVDNLD